MRLLLAALVWLTAPSSNLCWVVLGEGHPELMGPPKGTRSTLQVHQKDGLAKVCIFALEQVCGWRGGEDGGGVRGAPSIPSA